MNVRKKIAAALLAVAMSGVLLSVSSAPAQASGDGCSSQRINKLQGWWRDVGFPASGQQIGTIRISGTTEYTYCPTANYSTRKIKLQNTSWCWTFLNGFNPVLFDAVRFDPIYLNNNGKYIDPGWIYIVDNNGLQNCGTISLKSGWGGNMLNEWWNETSGPGWIVNATIIWHGGADQNTQLLYGGNPMRLFNSGADPNNSGWYRQHVVI